MVFLCEGSAHALADAPDTPLTDFAPERPHPLMRELPRLVRLPAHDELGRLVDLLAAELAKPRPGGDGIVSSLGHPWTVAELAARSGLSRSVFAQRFTTPIGEPPMAYLTWWRVTSAGLLSASPAPIAASLRQLWRNGDGCGFVCNPVIHV
ncbi:cupin domain-containing protein [Nonomuraea sp. 10N515B]|uniref:cupin domain-containing protein n=1 Tax=Nonomuraea sp. 10N515B TaxID=3457422 RepID=UPI003FCCD247